MTQTTIYCTSRPVRHYAYLTCTYAPKQMRNVSDLIIQTSFYRVTYVNTQLRVKLTWTQFPTFAWIPHESLVWISHETHDLGAFHARIIPEKLRWETVLTHWSLFNHVFCNLDINSQINKHPYSALIFHKWNKKCFIAFSF